MINSPLSLWATKPQSTPSRASPKLLTRNWSAHGALLNNAIRKNSCVAQRYLLSCNGFPYDPFLCRIYYIEVSDAG
jgi:hypothetical protein